MIAYPQDSLSPSMWQRHVEMALLIVLHCINFLWTDDLDKFDKIAQIHAIFFPTSNGNILSYQLFVLLTLFLNAEIPLFHPIALSRAEHFPHWTVFLFAHYSYSYPCHLQWSVQFYAEAARRRATP